MGRAITYPTVNGHGLFTVQSSGTTTTKQGWGCKRKNLKEPYVKIKEGFENFEVTVASALLGPSEMRIWLVENSKLKWIPPSHATLFLIFGVPWPSGPRPLIAPAPAAPERECTQVEIKAHTSEKIVSHM